MKLQNEYPLDKPNPLDKSKIKYTKAELLNHRYKDTWQEWTLIHVST